MSPGENNPRSGARGWIGRHSVPLYFVLVYAITWACVLLVAGPEALRRAFLGEGFSFENLQRALISFFVMIAVVSITGVTLTAAVDGKAGLRDLLTRMTRWRAGARWYAVALLTTPLLATATSLALSLLSPDFLPGVFTTDDKVALLLQGVVLGLLAGFFEEIGWSGFAVPKVRLRHSILTTGLMVGALWGGWHFMADLWGRSGSYGALFVPYFLVYYVASLMAYRVLMVWVYDHTESLLLMQLMHAFYSGVLFVLAPSGISATQNLLYSALFAAALWVVVAVVARTQGRRFVQHPVQQGAT